MRKKFVFCPVAKYVIKQKGTRFLKNQLITLMAVMDPSFVGPEAYYNFEGPLSE